MPGLQDVTMLSSLKSSISKTVQSITEKLSSSFSREENKGEEKYRHRPSLKRSRTGYDYFYWSHLLSLS